MGTYTNRLNQTQPGVTKLIGKDGEITYMEDIYQTLVEQLWDTGVATSGNGTTCVNTLVAMETDLYKGGIIEIQIGTKSHSRIVLSNTATTFTFAALDGGAVVVAGCKYQVKQKVNSMNLLQIGGTPQTGADWSTYLNNINKKSQSLVTANVVCTNANEEYSQSLPVGCKQFSIRVRGGMPDNTLSIAFVTGLVPPGTGLSIIKITNDNVFGMDNIELASTVVYFSNTLAGAIVEIISCS